MDDLPGVIGLCEEITGRPIARPAGADPLDLAASGLVVIDRSLLGRGVFNEVHCCTLGSRRGKTARRIAIKPIKPQFFNGKPTTVQAGVGIDPARPRLACRNMATAVLDRLLGTRAVPDATPMVIDGEHVLAMTLAPGVPAPRFYRSDPAIVSDPAFQRGINDLEMLAYLSGNPDIHSGNILIAAAKREGAVGEPRVTLIDNDLAFGPRVDNPDQMPGISGDNARQYRHTGLPAYIDINTASRIRSLDRAASLGALRPFLTDAESAAFEARLDRALRHIDYLRAADRVILDWARFANVRDATVDGGDLIAGTLQFAGVLQGRQGGTSHFAPRSLITRDCLEGRLGGDDALDALLGPARRRQLTDWSRSAKAHVPPSGLDHC